MKPGLRRLTVGVTSVVGAAAVVGSLMVLLGPVAWRLGGDTLAGLQGKDRADAINSARQTLLAAAGGTAALVGLGFTARTYFLSRRGQLTDRYTKAITQLSSARLTERLGGIYALEHLMAESARDHNTVVEVLAAFIRESAPALRRAYVDGAQLQDAYLRGAQARDAFGLSIEQVHSAILDAATEIDPVLRRLLAERTPGRQGGR